MAVLGLLGSIALTLLVGCGSYSNAVEADGGGRGDAGDATDAGGEAALPQESGPDVDGAADTGALEGAAEASPSNDSGGGTVPGVAATLEPLAGTVSGCSSTEGCPCVQPGDPNYSYCGYCATIGMCAYCQNGEYCASDPCQITTTSGCSTSPDSCPAADSVDCGDGTCCPTAYPVCCPGSSTCATSTANCSSEN